MARYVPSGKEVFIDIDLIKKGLEVKDDQSLSAIGSFQSMSDTQLTDRGGVGPRLGQKRVGDKDTTGFKIKGFYNFKRSFDSEEILIKNVGDKTFAYSSKNNGLGWFDIKSGNTVDKEWGYITSLVNEQDTDLLIGGNRFDDMISWTGNYSKLIADTVANSSVVSVESVLNDGVYLTGINSSSEDTSVLDEGKEWAIDQWKNMYVHFKRTGLVKKILSNTNDTLTTDVFGENTNNEDFEIRTLKFSVGEKVYINGDDYEISLLDRATEITMTENIGSVKTSGTAVSESFKTYSGLPKGNRYTNWLGKVFIGNVRSASALGAGGTKQGYSTGGSAFVSKIKNPIDFDYSASRVAGEGDIISTPYGGGDITDIKHFEKQAYLFKEDYIEAIDYTQDGGDVVTREPLKVNIGSIGKVIVGSDDIYFITKDKEFTSIGRAANKDLKPETSNLGFKIKRLLDTYEFQDVSGIQYKDKIYITCRENSDSANNDRTLVYNKEYKTFESVWNKGFFAFVEWEGKLMGADSSSGDVQELLKGTDDNGIKISSNFQTNFSNFVSTKSNMQATNGLYLEGWVDDRTSFTVNLYKDFEKSPFVTFDFDPSANEFDNGLTSTILSGSYLGKDYKGLQPLGVLTQDVDLEGKRRFFMRVFFPFVYGRYYSFGCQSSFKGNYEIIRFGPILKEQFNINTENIKSVI